MGTRADFYVGRGESAEWLGSTAWDGYPDGFKDTPLLGATDEATYRAEVAALATREDFTAPEFGWPWPWIDSRTIASGATASGGSALPAPEPPPPPWLGGSALSPEAYAETLRAIESRAAFYHGQPGADVDWLLGIVRGIRLRGAALPAEHAPPASDSEKLTMLADEYARQEPNGMVPWGFWRFVEFLIQRGVSVGSRPALAGSALTKLLLDTAWEHTAAGPCWCDRDGPLHSERCQRIQAAFVESGQALGAKP